MRSTARRRPWRSEAGRIRFNSPLYLDLQCLSGVSGPECKSAVEDFEALCGSAPTDSGVKQATFKEGLVSLPDPCSRWQMVLTFSLPQTLKLEDDWRRALLRLTSELQEAIALESRVVPYIDPELKRKPRCYARLIRDMRFAWSCVVRTTLTVHRWRFCRPKETWETEVNFDTR